jgi:hypothetical protein
MRINYEKAVKQKFPEAFRVGVTIDKNYKDPMFHMIVGCGLGENYSRSPYLAWKNAFEKLNRAKA